MARNRNINLMQSGLLPILAFNLMFTFVVGGISIGGHIGGLWVAWSRRSWSRSSRSAAAGRVDRRRLLRVLSVAIGVATVAIV